MFKNNKKMREEDTSNKGREKERKRKIKTLFFKWDFF